ncbi:MAG TPA: hypothetical protein PLC74_11420 [Acetobacteraceae bacterium]|nr:hypothetical protein [Acetobacteraceae bacterium]
MSKADSSRADQTGDSLAISSISRHFMVPHTEIIAHLSSVMRVITEAQIECSMALLRAQADMVQAWLPAAPLLAAETDPPYLAARKAEHVH